MAENDINTGASTSEDVIFDNNGIYIPQNWQDTLEQFTVFSPERMNHIEQGIKKNSEKIKENWDSISQALLFTHVPWSSNSYKVPDDVHRLIIIFMHNATFQLNGIIFWNDEYGSFIPIVGCSYVGGSFDNNSRMLTWNTTQGNADAYLIPVPFNL